MSPSWTANTQIANRKPSLLCSIPNFTYLHKILPVVTEQTRFTERNIVSSFVTYYIPYIHEICFCSTDFCCGNLKLHIGDDNSHAYKYNGKAIPVTGHGGP
jgi:hypothetical protein